MIISRQREEFWIKISQVQERRDADVGEIENFEEAEEYREVYIRVDNSIMKKVTGNKQAPILSEKQILHRRD